MPEEGRVVRMQGDEKELKIELPDSKGHVMIYLNLVDTRLEAPLVFVELNAGPGDARYTWHTENGKRWTHTKLVGRPTVLKEQEDRFRLVLQAHSKGDHSGCPEDCEKGKA